MVLRSLEKLPGDVDLASEVSRSQGLDFSQNFLCTIPKSVVDENEGWREKVVGLQKEEVRRYNAW